MKRNIVKVRIDIVIEVDVDALNAEYGTSYSKREAAKDARESAFSSVMQSTYPYASNDAIIVSGELVNRHGRL